MGVGECKCVLVWSLWLFATALKIDNCTAATSTSQHGTHKRANWVLQNWQCLTFFLMLHVGVCIFIASSIACVCQYVCVSEFVYMCLWLIIRSTSVEQIFSSSSSKMKWSVVWNVRKLMLIFRKLGLRESERVAKKSRQVKITA